MADQPRQRRPAARRRPPGGMARARHGILGGDLPPGRLRHRAAPPPRSSGPGSRNTSHAGFFRADSADEAAATLAADGAPTSHRLLPRPRRGRPAAARLRIERRLDERRHRSQHRHRPERPARPDPGLLRRGELRPGDRSRRHARAGDQRRLRIRRASSSRRDAQELVDNLRVPGRGRVPAGRRETTSIVHDRIDRHRADRSPTPSRPTTSTSTTTTKSTTTTTSTTTDTDAADRPGQQQRERHGPPNTPGWRHQPGRQEGSRRTLRSRSRSPTRTRTRADKHEKDKEHGR